MTPDTRLTSAEDADDNDNGDPHAAYLKFAQSLTRTARERLSAWTRRTGRVEPAEPSQRELLLEVLERLKRLEPVRPPASEPQPAAYPALADAIEAAGLTGAERRVADAVARAGPMRLSELQLKFECDVLSVVKRAKPKLKAHGWNLFRHNNCIDAKPIQRNSK